jgi:hypothetical protein
MDDIYRSGFNEPSAISSAALHRNEDGPQDEKTAAAVHDFELDTILQQAVQGDKSRLYVSSVLPSATQPFVLGLQVWDRPDLGTSLTINAQDEGAPIALNLTIDAVKRCITRDSFVASQLGLYAGDVTLLRPFQLGSVDAQGQFVAFEFLKTLGQLRVKTGDTVCVKVLEMPAMSSVVSRSGSQSVRDSHSNAGGSDSDDEGRDGGIRERITRLNGYRYSDQ